MNYDTIRSVLLKQVLSEPLNEEEENIFQAIQFTEKLLKRAVKKSNCYFINGSVYLEMLPNNSCNIRGESFTKVLEHIYLLEYREMKIVVTHAISNVLKIDTTIAGTMYISYCHNIEEKTEELN